MKGILYGVSCGCGDSDDMTLKAVKCINNCEIIAVPRTNGKTTIALDIVKENVDLSDKDIMICDFAMSNDRAVVENAHKIIVDKVVKCLEDGKSVALINIGDVSIYSTYSYIAELVEKQGYETKRIAGVPSFCSVAEKLNISLTDLLSPIHIYPAMYEDLDVICQMDGTKILMKNKLSIESDKEILKKYKAMAVQNCGLITENICHDIEKIKDGNYFTTIVVK